MSLLLVTPPTEAVLTLAEAKAHLRLIGDDENDNVSAYLAAAEADVQEHTHRQLMRATYRLDGRGPLPELVYLPRPPFVAVTAVTVTTDNETTSLIDGTDFEAYGHEPGAIEFDRSAGALADKWSITFVAGYANAASVPAPIKQAIRLLLGTYFETRETFNMDLKVGAKPMAEPLAALLSKQRFRDQRTERWLLT